MSADTESFKRADTDTETDISAEISADTDTETDNFLSLVGTVHWFNLITLGHAVQVSIRDKLIT